MKWIALLTIIVPIFAAEIVVKPNGMLNVRMQSSSCGIPLDADVQDVEDVEPTLNFTQHESDTFGWDNKEHLLRISGGEIYHQNEFPFIALLGRSTGSGYQAFCAGSILSRTRILTAAHCMDGIDSTMLAVLAGAYEIDHPSTNWVRVGSISRHPSYDRNTLSNDIAMVSLKTPLKFSKNVGAISLPDDDIEDGTRVKILGWGAEKYQGVMTSKPKEMDTATISISSCHKQWGTCVRRTKPIQLCTYSKDAAPCQGDSGGPVIWMHGNTYVLVGIVSYGPQCTETKAAVHTKVEPFLSWIEQHIQGGL